jgi:hypothetical protein
MDWVVAGVIADRWIAGGMRVRLCRQVLKLLVYEALSF